MNSLNTLNKKLVLALAAQLVLVIAFWWPRNSQTLGRKSLFEKYDFAQIKQLNIREKSEGDKDSEVTLKKVNGAWVVGEEMDYPADETKINEFLNKLEKLDPGYPVAQTAAGYDRLQVGDQQFQRKVSFSTQVDDKSEAKDGLMIGSSPQFRKVHMRRIGEKQVYASSTLNPFDIPGKPQDWVKKKLLDVDSEKIEAIALTRGEESVALVRKEVELPKDAPKPAEDGKLPPPAPAKEKAWFLKGKDSQAEKKVDKSKFDSVLRNLTGLSFSHVIGKEPKPEHGLQKPTAIVQITAAKGEGQHEEKILHIGEKEGENYLVQLQGSPFVVSVPAAQLRDILETKAKDLVAAGS